MTRPFVLGLTGSIGMGKSTVAAMFARLGVPVFDADAVVHRLQGPDGPLLPAIEEAFPGTVGPAGLDRYALAAAVFEDAAALRRLEQIIHPAVRAEREAFLRQHAGSPLVVLDIPLLFETGVEDEVDAVLVVSAPPDVQRERVLARAGMTRELFAQVLARQVPDAEKRERASYVIGTGGELEATASDVRALVDKLTR